MSVFETHEGTSPIVLGLPHTGTNVPPEILARLNETGRKLTDTDWHVHTLYAGLLPEATTVRATFHRYVIDANRDPSGHSLYPGQNTTTLVPETDFDGRPIWREGMGPTEADLKERIADFHAPYHTELAAQIDRVKAIHGFAVLYDCHSIRSTIPFLFDGVLPNLNLGTNNGTTCAPALEAAALEACKIDETYTCVLNGRFKGGWTTRHYGHPEKGVHAIQMELAQSTHLKTEALPFAYDPEKAEHLRPVLQTLLQKLEASAQALSLTGAN